jgi:hypothetical protein
MAFRTVTGQFFKAGTMPWADAEVWFTLQKGSYSVDAHYPADSLKVRTDANGRISVDLWISEEAQSTTNWLCRQPSGETFKFGVPAGVGPIALEDLRAIGSPPVVPTPNLSALIDSRIAAHNADAAAHPGLGGGGPGGGLVSVPITSDAVAAPGNLYLAATPSILALSLPPISADGDSFGFINRGAGTVRVTQLADQKIVVGDEATTIGITGRISSFNYGDWVEFLYGDSIWWASIKSGYLEVT